MNKLAAICKSTIVLQYLLILFSANCIAEEGQNRGNAAANNGSAFRLSPQAVLTAQDAYLQGRILAGKRDYASAIAFLDRAIYLSPRWAEAYDLRGWCYQQLGQNRRAIQDFDQSISCNPKWTSAYQNREWSYKQLKDHPELLSVDVASTASGVASNPASGSAAAGSSNAGPADLASLPDGDTIPFSRTDSGQLYVNAEVSGRPIQMMFDTGANVCIMGTNHLRSIGIDPATLSGKPIMIGGSGGRAIKASMVPMSLKLGKTCRMIDMCVQDNMPTPPLVGQNFLTGLQFEVNNQLEVVRLRKQGSKDATTVEGDGRIDPRDRNAVPFVMKGKNIVVPVEICGKEVSMIFDTGCDGVAFPLRVWQQLHLPAKLLGAGSSRGVDGASLCFYYTVDRIDFGPVALRNVRVAVSNPGPSMPLLGQSILGGEKFIIDETAKAIRFHR